MKVRHTPKGEHLPRLFHRIPKWGRLVSYEARIKLSPRSRLQLKVLTFKSNRDLRTFWREALGRPDLCRQTRGVCTALGYELYRNVGKPNEEHILMVDPRYFAIIGLIEGQINSEVLAHEACHAGFAFAGRHGKGFWVDRDEFGEEDVCYPTGKITAHLNNLMHEWGLYVPQRRNPGSRG
jgi:hypothetical protein